MHIDRFLQMKGFARNTSFGGFDRGPNYNINWTIKNPAKMVVGAIAYTREKDFYPFAPRMPHILY